MNTTAWSKAAQTSAVVLIAVLGLAGLSGCEQQSYPSPSMEAQAGPPPPPPPAELMGAPEGPGAPPPPPSAYPPPGGPETGNLTPPPPGAYAAGPEAGPPPGAEAPSAYPGPQHYAENQPPYGAQPYAPPYPPPGYPAYGQPHPPVVISNAPIPNPIEPERHGGWRHHHHHEGQAAGPAREEHALRHHHHHAAAHQHRVWRHGHWVHEAAPAKPVAEHHHHHAVAQHHAAVAHHGKMAHHHHVATHVPALPIHHPAAVAHHHAQPAHHHAAVATHAAKVHHAAKPAPVATPAHAHVVHHPHAVIHAAPKITPLHHKTAPALKPPTLPQVTPITPSQAKRQAAQTASSGQTGNLTTATNGADQAARLQSLQSALTDLVNRRAQLKAPAHFAPNQPVDVTLVLPADFAQAVQTEAAKDNLSAAAASANLTAVLSGDGFAATPDQPQSLPLTPGQVTQFHWTVTAQPGAKGPLHADLSADLLGAAGPQNLALGSVSTIPATGGNTGRIIGISLLVIIAVIVIGWLSTRRRRPEPVGATRPRNNHHGDIETSV